jgi:hypothetical protein
MRCRRHGSKPTLALWMLVAVADVAVLIAAAGLVTVLVVLAALVTVAGAGAGMVMLARRDTTRAEAVVRRRA